MAAGSAIIYRLSGGNIVGNMQGLSLSLRKMKVSLSSSLSEEGEEEVFGIEELPDVLVEELDRRHRVRIELGGEEPQEARQPCREAFSYERGTPCNKCQAPGRCRANAPDQTVVSRIRT